jgi:outer membrane protein assembly factor BamE (lipoprotein component of BamABCDE complex)
VAKGALAVGVLIIVVVIVVAVLGHGSSSNTRGQSSKEITPAGFAQVHNGADKSGVRRILGTPENISVVQGLECWYYVGASSAAAQYELCFRNGRVDYRGRP